MPNWCDNELTIRGKSVEELKTFTGMDRGMLDFNLILPYPEEFVRLDQIAEEARNKNPKDFSIKDGYNSGGYEWCVKNWGTKWNVGKDIQIAEQIKPTELKASFDTAWSPPLNVFLILSEKFPDCKIKIKYYEAGMGFKGIFICKSGEIISDSVSDYKGSRGG
jgi:hypothetical protein